MKKNIFKNYYLIKNLYPEYAKNTKLKKKKLNYK